MVRTRVDGSLLREVVDEVRSEYAAGRVRLDAVSIRAPEPAPMVEVFHVDLVLVLKNVVRNAILAAGRAPAPRRVGIDVETRVEVTGEELVRIVVRDSSEEPLDTEQIYARRMDRGLGLVTAALARYDGVIEVEPGGAGWAKAVVVRFFRAYGDEDEHD
jgi:C4-dicarboxylate-specific signal transduction histidine kinase